MTGEGGDRRSRLAARAAWLAAAIAVWTGCVGSSVNEPAILAGFDGSGTPASANQVRLLSSASNGDVVTLEVALGGPTSSTDLYSFAFDLVLSDPTVAQYVSGSAHAGDALQVTGIQSQSALASQVGDRVVVGVSKLGGGPGNGIAGSESVLMTLSFRILRKDVTGISFGGTPTAIDSGGSRVGTVAFDSQPARLSGS